MFHNGCAISNSKTVTSFFTLHLFVSESIIESV